MGLCFEMTMRITYTLVPCPVQKDAEEIPPMNCEDSSKNNVHGHGHETTQEASALISFLCCC
jgi:hypothetical protein